MPTCSDCGHENAQGLKFCLQCGSKITAQAPASESAACPDCGHANPKGIKFCLQCGFHMPVDAPAAAPAPKEEDLGPSGTFQALPQKDVQAAVEKIQQERAGEKPKTSTQELTKPKTSTQELTKPKTSTQDLAKPTLTPEQQQLADSLAGSERTVGDREEDDEPIMLTSQDQLAAVPKDDGPTGVLSMGDIMPTGTGLAPKPAAPAMPKDDGPTGVLSMGDIMPTGTGLAAKAGIESDGATGVLSVDDIMPTGTGLAPKATVPETPAAPQQPPSDPASGSGLATNPKLLRALAPNKKSSAPIQQPQSPDPVLGQQFSNYTVESREGEGLFGPTYRVVHTNMRQPATMQLLRLSPPNDPELIEKFRAEAQRYAQLHHQHIATLADFGAFPKVGFCVVTEHLDGKNLYQRLKEGEEFPLSRIQNIMEQLCRALQHAHQKSLTHQDLQPDVIYLVADDEKGESVKLTNFGLNALYRELGQLPTLQSHTEMSRYMSPEQAQNIPRAHIDLRSDLYSLGLILYSLLAGECAFDGDTPQALFHHQVHTPPRPLYKVTPGKEWSPVLEDFLKVALAKSPDTRPATAMNFWYRCEAALAAQAEVLSGPAAFAIESESDASFSVSGADFPAALSVVNTTSSVEMIAPVRGLDLPTSSAARGAPSAGGGRDFSDDGGRDFSFYDDDGASSGDDGAMVEFFEEDPFAKKPGLPIKWLALGGGLLLVVIAFFMLSGPSGNNVAKKGPATRRKTPKRTPPRKVAAPGRTQPRPAPVRAVEPRTPEPRTPEPRTPEPRTPEPRTPEPRVAPAPLRRRVVRRVRKRKIRRLRIRRPVRVRRPVRRRVRVARAGGGAAAKKYRSTYRRITSWRRRHGISARDMGKLAGSLRSAQKQARKRKYAEATKALEGLIGKLGGLKELPRSVVQRKFQRLQSKHQSATKAKRVADHKLKIVENQLFPKIYQAFVASNFDQMNSLMNKAFKLLR